MIIKAICTKDHKADGITICKKGEEIEMTVVDDTYRQPQFYPRCPYADEDEMRIEGLRDRPMSCKVFEFKKDWINIRLLDTEEAAMYHSRNGNKNLVFSEYFKVKSSKELTAENVENLHNACLTTKHSNFVTIFGIQNNYTYDKSDIELYKEEIRSMLMQLPETFRKSKGGGWSFLNMCMRADDVQWTGLHSTVEKLVTLGMAADLCDYILPREMWKVLPGEMPYIVIKD